MLRGSRCQGLTSACAGRSGGVCSLGESDVEIYDGDIGEIGNYDYLFSSHCPTTTAF